MMKSLLMAVVMLVTSPAAYAMDFAVPESPNTVEFSGGYGISDDMKGYHFGAAYSWRGMVDLGVGVGRSESRMGSPGWWYPTIEHVDPGFELEFYSLRDMAPSLATAYPAAHSFTTLTVSPYLALHPLSVWKNAPVDLAVTLGYERSFYEDEDIPGFRSWAYSIGGDVSRSFNLFAGLSVKPWAGVEWAWATVRNDTPDYSRGIEIFPIYDIDLIDPGFYLPVTFVPYDYDEDYVRMTVQTGLRLAYLLPTGQSIHVDNSLSMWKRRSSDDRVFAYNVAVGISLPR